MRPTISTSISKPERYPSATAGHLEKLPSQHERQETFRLFDDQRKSLTLRVERNQFGQPEYVRVEGLHDAN